MKTVAVLLLISMAMAKSVLANDCAGQSDGTVVHTACRSYTYCSSGQEVVRDCAETEAFNSNTQTCSSITTVPAPCGYYRDCTGLANRRYVDNGTGGQGCRAYYTCHNGYFYGFNFCPGTLLYDEPLQLCNWPASVTCTEPAV